MAFETQVGSARETQDAGAPAATAIAGGSGLRALVGLTLVVIVFQILQGLNSDTSWLLTVAGRWLQSARVYVEILESNPPSSFLPLVPALIVSHLTGLPPEPLIIAGVAFAALGVIELTVRQAAMAGLIDSPARTRLALGFSLLVLPVSIFAEREHMAVIALVPMWAAMVVRAEGRALSRAFLIAAGLGGGLAMCVKPQFAAAILLPAIAVARSRRTFAAMFLGEYWLAAGVVGLFALVVLLGFPEYGGQMVPLVIDLYRPIREPLGVLLATEPLLWTSVALIGLWLVARDRVAEPRIVVPLLAALGMAASVLEQGKGFAYHYYPVVAALAPALIDHGVGLANERFGPTAERSGRLTTVAGFVLIATGLAFATLYFHGVSKPMAVLVGPIERLKPMPTMVAITPHIWLGHPLVHELGGRWVGSVPNQWMTLGALYKLGLKPPTEPERARLQAVIDSDRARMLSDIARGKPDIVLVEHDDRVFPAWFGSDAELGDFLTGYRRAFIAFDRIDVWVHEGNGTR